MSKVYSFRLDENNPREAQAKEVIEAWVREGYTLRHGIVEALITNKKYNLEEILEKITQLLETSIKRNGVGKDVQPTLSDTFVGSISKSVKNGVRMK